MPRSHFLSPLIVYAPLHQPTHSIIHVHCCVGMKDTLWIIACDSWERIWVISWYSPRDYRTISDYEDRRCTWTVTLHGSAYRHTDTEHDRTRERYPSRSATFFRAWDAPVKTSPLLSEGKSEWISRAYVIVRWSICTSLRDAWEVLGIWRHGGFFSERYQNRFEYRLLSYFSILGSAGMKISYRTSVYQGSENHSFPTEITLFFSHKTWKNTGIS